MTGAGASLIRAEQSREQQGDCCDGQVWPRETRERLGELSCESEQWGGDALGSAKGTFDGVLHFELFEGGAGLFGQVRRSLVGYILGAGTIDERLFQDRDDDIGRLVFRDDDRVEQGLVPATDVLGGDELQGHTECTQIGRISGQLRLWENNRETKASSTRRTLPGRWRLVILDRR